MSGVIATRTPATFRPSNVCILKSIRGRSSPKVEPDVLIGLLGATLESASPNLILTRKSLPTAAGSHPAPARTPSPPVPPHAPRR